MLKDEVIFGSTLRPVALTARAPDSKSGDVGSNPSGLFMKDASSELWSVEGCYSIQRKWHEFDKSRDTASVVPTVYTIEPFERVNHVINYERWVLTVLEKIAQFFREVRSELKKVTWPPRKETIASTSVVLVLVFFISLFLFFVDQCLSFLIRLILNA